MRRASDSYIARSSSKASAAPLRQGAYAIVTEAIVESALVTWVGILLFEIGTFAPHGKVVEQWLAVRCTM